MAERNQKVFDRVRQELGKNTKLGSRELYEIAKGVDEAIAEETLQQFHARYVLPVRREESRNRGGNSPAKAPRRSGRKKKAAEEATPAREKRASRAAISAQAVIQERQRARGVLLKFAQEFSTAETKPEIIEVMSRLDEYVDQLISNQD